jgi:hypothetical protein
MRDKAAASLRQSRTLPRSDEERRVDRHIAKSYKDLAETQTGLDEDHTTDVHKPAAVSKRPDPESGSGSPPLE